MRFSATAFLNHPLILTPIAPYIGRPIKGKLIDLSAGGLSMVIGLIIPQGTRLHLTLTFPDHTVLETDTEVKHMVPRDRHYLHGLEFLNLDPLLEERISKMSTDYIDCESRIQTAAPDVCQGTGCAFYTMCTKVERKNLILDVNKEASLTLSFSHQRDKICLQPK